MSLDRFRCTLVTIRAEDTVEAAARLMRDRRVGSLLLVRAGRPIGIVTDRDLVIRALAEGRDGVRTTVGDVATYDPITVSVGDGIETAVFLMRKHGIRRLPLVDEAGLGIGIVTADDLLVLFGGEIAGLGEGLENRTDSEDSR